MLTLIKGIQKSPTLNTLYAIKPVRFNAIKSKLSPTTLEKWGGEKKKKCMRNMHQSITGSSRDNLTLECNDL